MVKNDFVYTGTGNLEAMTEAKNYNNYLIDIILRSVKNKKIKLLDFGAGSGTYADMLKNKNLKVDCLEPDQDLQQVLTKKGFKVFGDISEVKKESYDIIYALNVLEHIEDDNKIFRQLTSLLKKDGIIIIYVPAFQSLFSTMDKLVEHYRRYRKHHLKKMVTDNNLHIIELTYRDPIGFIAAAAFKIIGSKDGTISVKSVKFYDKVAFPISKAFEPLSKRVIGKNLLLLATKNKAIILATHV